MALNQTVNKFSTQEMQIAAEESEMEGKYLSFWTDGQLFAVPIADVVQIVGVQAITELPEAPYYVKGIIDLRGSVIPIIDVRLRLGKAEKVHDERTCIIVTNIYDRLMGFVVDAVDEVTDISTELISMPPQMGGNGATYLTGVALKEKRVILLVSTKRLMGEEEMLDIA